MTRFFDREAWTRTADWLAVAVAVTLPWSVSATAIAVVLWLIAVVPTLDWPSLRRALLTPAAGLAVALFVLGAVGTLWADVPMIERWRGLDSFFKLLVIPVLFVQFRRSERGHLVLVGFLISTAVLLAVSAFSVFSPAGKLWGLGKTYGVPVKDYIAQSGEFTLSAFGAFYLALQAFRGNRSCLAIAWALLGCAFLADIAAVTTSRTALVTIPFLAVVFAATQFSGRTMIAVLLLGCAIVFGVGIVSPVTRGRLMHLVQEIEQYQTSNRATSAGERLEFWKKAWTMVGEAPVIGHGTGTIRDLYRKAAVGRTGVGAEVAANPHNQTLAVAIQLGAVGAALLLAMWLAHFALFRGGGFPAFVGLVLVVQNVVGSLFNSHLFDFTQGWIYVFGIGVAGGMVLAHRDKAASASGDLARGG